MCKTLQTNCILNRYIYIFLSLFCSAFFLSAGVSKASLKAVRLSVSLESDRSDPVREVPFFSWQITSEKRNLQQAAWRVQLSPGNSGFGNPGNLVWDSGKILSGESVLVPGHGAALLPANSYTWRVKVWSLEGEESGWSEPAFFSTGLWSPDDWQKAAWIGYEQLAENKKLVPGVHGKGDNLGDVAVDRPVVPLFRKEFEIAKPVREAKLYISGLGHYEASVNGSKAGEGFLAPGWTNYDKTIFYNILDVTGMLKSGKNALGVIVGNGFYNINRERYRKLVIAWGNPKMICQLRIRYSDGSEEVVVSGPDWKAAASPIYYTSIFGGEDYDASMEQHGWDQPQFDDSSWKPALTVRPPSGMLTREYDHPLKVKESFQAVTVKKLADGGYLYDFGQNASGIVELKVKGVKGQEIKLTPSELITAEGQPNQSASGSPYHFTYILKGGGTETWRPRFTYYGFRYVKLEGAVPEGQKAPGNPAILLDLRLLHTRNSTPSAGTFSCSYDLYNKTFNLINWGIKSNLQSVLTDCPHREKLGWLEQTFLMGSAVHFNFNLYHLYRKQVADMMEAQLDNGLVPDIAPEYVVFNAGFRDSPEWGSASVILPWLIYKWYGDASVMEKAWSMMMRYAEYLESKSDGQILSHGLGDWFDLGPRQPGEAQLTPKALTATAIYYYDVKLLAEMAEILGKTSEKERLSAWAEKIKASFHAKFVDPVAGVISTGSQTAMAMPWCVGLVEGKLAEKVMQNLEDSIRANGNPLTAGDVGFHYVVAALTRSGRSQLLHEMNARDDVPGYGYQLKKGATALTESWAALENVSNNHLMLGHLMDWFYAGLAGIGQTGGSVGYREVVIKPELVEGMEHASATYHSPYGEISSAWEKSGKTAGFRISVPGNTRALVYLPAGKQSVIREGGVPAGKAGINRVGEEDGRVIFRLGSGNYEFTVEN